MIAGKNFMTLAEKEKQYILEVLAATGGNKSKTAEMLGISRAALWRKLKQFGEENRPSKRKKNTFAIWSPIRGTHKFRSPEFFRESYAVVTFTPVFVSL